MRADNKKAAQLALIADLLDSFDYKGKREKLTKPDRDVVFPWSEKKADLLSS